MSIKTNLMVHRQYWPLLLAAMVPTLTIADEPLFQLVRAIHNPDRTARADFGRSVAITPAGIVISAAMDPTVGKDSGAIYFFGTDGEFRRKVTHPDGVVGALFGLSLDVTGSGDIVVGNYTQIQPDRVDRSRAYHFDAQGNLKQTLASPTEVTGSFGTEVATIGDTILIGSLRDSTAAFQAGAVYAYEPGAVEPRRFVAPDPVELALLGNSITPLDHGKFVASAYTESDSEFATGAVYIFDLNGDEVVRIPDPAPKEYNYFGIETNRVGDNILVSSLEQRGDVQTGGVAYLFDQEGRLLRQFDNPHPSVDDFFGYDLAGVGDYVVIGAPSEGSRGYLAGAAYVFDQEGNLLQELYDPTPGDSAGFGLLHAMGDTLYISASYDGGGPNARGPGAVYIYKLNLLPGDVNMDSRVNLDDFISLRKHFGQDVNARSDGDLTGDLKVDLADFIQLRANFGKVAPVPEPGGVALTLLAAGGLAWMGLRRRRQ